MARDLVLYKRQGQVAHVTLNRPRASNIINADLAIALRDVVQQIAEDDEAHIALFTGAGTTFSAGSDPIQFSKAGNERDGNWPGYVTWKYAPGRFDGLPGEHGRL